MLAVLWLSGCAADGGSGRAEPLRSPGPSLIAIRTIAAAPVGGDGPTKVEIAWQEPNGALRPVRLQRPVTAFLAWGPTAVAVDDHRALWLAPDGATPRQVGTDATGELAVSADGSLLAWVSLPRLLGELRVRSSGGAEHTIAGQLQSAGALRFSPDGSAVLFRGARLGGVAGLFVADVAGGRVECLSNCALRSGRPWPEPLVVGPASPEELAFDADTVSWSAPGGQRVVRRWRSGAR